MGRSVRISPSGHVVTVISMLTWWAAACLAVVGHFVLHEFASHPIAISTMPGQVSSAILPLVLKGFASVGQYILPVLCILASITFWFKWKMSTPLQGSPALLNVSKSVTQQELVGPMFSSPMVLKAAKSGNNAGKSFSGCSNYPRCNGTRLAE